MKTFFKYVCILCTSALRRRLSLLFYDDCWVKQVRTNCIAPRRDAQRGADFLLFCKLFWSQKTVENYLENRAKKPSLHRIFRMLPAHKRHIFL